LNADRAAGKRERRQPEQLEKRQRPPHLFKERCGLDVQRSTSGKDKKDAQQLYTSTSSIASEQPSVTMGIQMDLLVFGAEVDMLDVVGTGVVEEVEQLGYASNTLKQYFVVAMVLFLYLTSRVPAS